MPEDSSGADTIGYDQHTALVVVDVQNDFADPNGNLYVEGGEQVVPVVNEAVRRAGADGAMVVYTQDWHPEVTPHFEKDGGTWPVHCVAGTWGAELHPDVEVAGETLRKGTGGEDGYSGFTVQDPTSGARAATGLEEMLRRRGIRRVVIAGIATDVCVKATALDAVDKGFDTTVLRQGVRAVNLHPGDDERALEEMAVAGVSIV